MNTPVRYLFLTAALALSALCQSQNCDDNFVKCTTMLDSVGIKQSVAVTYFDGAGRESVSSMRTALGGYSHALTTYDTRGRVSMKALPYLNGSIYCPDSATIISSIPGHYQGDHRAYTTYSYDDLNRVIAEVGPGEAWTSHPLSMSYGSNTANEVWRFYLNGENVSHQGNWPACSLTKETHTDEDGHTTVVFKDMRGLTLLSLKGGSKTYYVYDHRDQLRYVLPPAAVEQMSVNGTWGPSSPVVSKYAYVYRYDDRGYCVWKKLPGCEEQQLWYDRCGRLLYAEDGNLRANGDLRFCLYDDKGRLAVEGLCKADWLQYANRAIAVTQMTGTGICGGYEPLGSMDSIRLITVHYYDDYTFMQTLPQGTSDSLAFMQTALVPTYSSARGFVTGRRVYQLGTEGVYEAQAFYYDRNGRVVQKNSSGGMRGTRHETTRYSFTGNPVERLVAFNANVNGTRHALTEAFSYEYNTYTDQLVSIAHSINGSTPVTLASYTYDALGRTTTKTIGGTETVSYSYNIRSWPTKIQSDKFTELMAYNAPVNGMTVSYPRWNGDISALCWKGDGKGATYRGYEFDYDDMDRLVCAWYGGGLNFSGTEDYYDEYFTYDRMGNITNLMRGGRLDDNSYGLIDDLDMEYDGNRLTRVYDYSSDDDPTYEGVMQFTDNTDEDEEYEYDANGNMTKDLNSNISSVQYNCLNLPSEVTVCRELAPSPPQNNSSYETTTMRYTYNADGEKLQATPEHFHLAGESVFPFGTQQLDGALRADSVVEAGAQGRDGGVMPPALDLSTRYCGNVIFERGRVKMLLTDEGYVTFTSGGTPVYHYYLRDHLGNVRVVFTGNFIGVIEQRNDYYPSGALMATSTDGSVQPYKYNGKELERTAGLDLYDYGARWMDSKIGARFTTMDPLCENYYGISPYAYCGDNPVNAIDPDGRKGYSLHRTSNGTTRNRSPKKFYQAMVLFGKTTFGHQLLADFTPEGETFFGVKGNGRYADFDMVINVYDYNIDEQAAKLYVGNGKFVNGQTQLNSTHDGKPRFDVIIDAHLEFDELLETICHEFCIHLSSYSEALEQYKKTGNFNDANKVWNRESGSQQHKDILRGKQGKLNGTKNYYNTVKEVINSNPKMKKVFDNKIKDYEKRYK